MTDGEHLPTDTAIDMAIEWDVPIPMDDGIRLRADVFRPRAAGSYPVILSMGPYAKGLHFQDGYPRQWNVMVSAYPEVLEKTSGQFMSWEVVDPERWVPDGYICIRVDSRGAGRSPGVLDTYSPREARDYYACIEWTAAQPWCNGRVGLLGISYYAVNQWHVAALAPPHLSAICVWEGSSDYYRESNRHGGILCDRRSRWFHNQVVPVQHGVGKRSARSRITGEPVAGPETLDEAELNRNRVEPGDEVRARPLIDDYYRARTANLAQITVPLLSVGNWGGQAGHLRGNIEGYLSVSSTWKWLQIHGNNHFSPFYVNDGLVLQKQFFGHFLQDEENGWAQRPPVTLDIRHPGERFVQRSEQGWPLPQTRWTRFYLDPMTQSLSEAAVAGPSLSYDALGEGVTFLTPPLEENTEITGPAMARLLLSSETTDADVFLVLRAFDRDGDEVLFIGTDDLQVPVSRGWLRASHRKLDSARSTPYRPVHTHDEVWLLEPGRAVPLDIEIWPTCVVVPAGYRIGLTISGHDAIYPPSALENGKTSAKPLGPLLHSHQDPDDRPVTIFGGRNTLHFSRGQEPYLLLPIIPAGDTTTA